jgi:hypothetical protein
VWYGGEWFDGVWHDGVWRDGEWRGGEWYDGEWCDGVWCGGVWHDGVWHGGVWRGGVWRGGEWHGGGWYGGVWCGGKWYDGEWHGGEWSRGEWYDKIIGDRLAYMAAMIGIVPDSSGNCVAYRTTEADGRGRYDSNFIQPAGEYREDDAAPSGSGTCCNGIHVTTAARAWTYFSVDPSCQMWRVTFKWIDLLDCDGEKARIRGGYFEKIETPWVAPSETEER